jgi:chromosome partitioning protein
VRTIAVINQKGGVGKTTTVANLGAAVADRGRSVCLLDLDPQAHLTLHFGVEPDGTDLSMYDVLSGESKLAPTLLAVRPSVWLGPSSIDLAGAEIEMVNTVGREQVLRDALADADLPQELVFIDCPPSLGLLTLNALAGADEVIIPLQPHFLALQGLGKLLETVSLVQRRINPQLTVSGVILCMYETTTRLAGEVRDDLRAFLDTARGGETPWANAHVFQTFIRRNVKLAECPSHGRTIFDYDRSSHGAEDYAALADEFLSLRGAEAALPVRRQDVPQQYVPEWAARPTEADAARPAEPPA